MTGFLAHAATASSKSPTNWGGGKYDIMVPSSCTIYVLLCEVATVGFTAMYSTHSVGTIGIGS
jgi:hypothetical protein